MQHRAYGGACVARNREGGKEVRCADLRRKGILPVARSLVWRVAQCGSPTERPLDPHSSGLAMQHRAYVKACVARGREGRRCDRRTFARNMADGESHGTRISIRSLLLWVSRSVHRSLCRSLAGSFHGLLSAAAGPSDP